jgi:hypothetical protein
MHFIILHPSPNILYYKNKIKGDKYLRTDKVIYEKKKNEEGRYTESDAGTSNLTLFFLDTTNIFLS